MFLFRPEIKSHEFDAIRIISISGVAQGVPGPVLNTEHSRSTIDSQINNTIIVSLNTEAPEIIVIIQQPTVLLRFPRYQHPTYSAFYSCFSHRSCFPVILGPRSVVCFRSVLVPVISAILGPFCVLHFHFRYHLGPGPRSVLPPFPAIRSHRSYFRS